MRVIYYNALNYRMRMLPKLTVIKPRSTGHGKAPLLEAKLFANALASGVIAYDVRRREHQGPFLRVPYLSIASTPYSKFEV